MAWSRTDIQRHSRSAKSSLVLFRQRNFFYSFTSGLGYIVGAQVASLAGAWYWSLRVGFLTLDVRSVWCQHSFHCYFNPTGHSGPRPSLRSDRVVPGRRAAERGLGRGQALDNHVLHGRHQVLVETVSAAADDDDDDDNILWHVLWDIICGKTAIDLMMTM